MRLATTLAAFLILASAPRAQTAADFYPLDPGNEWVYRIDDFGELFFQHDRIAGTTTVEGTDYAQRERCDIPVVEGGLGAPDCATALVRLDGDDVVVRQPDGSERQEICGLGRADGAQVPCDDVTGGFGATLEIQRTGPTTIRVGDYEVAASAVQAFEPVGVFIDPPPARYAAGIGRLAVFPFGGYQERFEYARVGDAEYGLNPLEPDPASFVPLAVGTVREYIRFLIEAGGPLVREDDVRTVVLDGETWTLRRTQERTGFEPYGRSETRRLLRFDAASATVLDRATGGPALGGYPCGFDVPVGESDCEGFPVYKTLAQTVEVGDETRETATLHILTLEPAYTLAAGLGLVYTVGGPLPDIPLRYIDVGPLPTGDPLPLGTPFGDFFPTTPDPTPAHLYYPLSVGDEWHTETGSFGVPQAFQRRRIVGSETVEGVEYAVEEHSSASPQNPAWSAPTTRLVRFDPVSGQPVTPEQDGSEACPLDEPVNDEESGAVVLCDADAYLAAFRSPGPLQQTGGPSIQTEAYKTFAYVGLADGSSAAHYVPGIGPVPEEVPFTPGSVYARLAYARVLQEDGSTRTVGTPLPVDGESAPPTAALAVTPSPNPTAGALRLAVTVPTAGALTVEAFDALGRRVVSDTRDAAVGALSLDLDASGWAPGAYVVRVRMADGVATARVVRR